MSARITRGSVAKEVALLASDKENSIQLSNPRSIPTSFREKNRAVKQQASKAELRDDKSVLPADKGTKRKREKAPKFEEDSDELPHNMGKRPSTKKGQLKSERAGEAERTSKEAAANSVEAKDPIHDTKAVLTSAKATTMPEESPKKKPKFIHNKSPFSDWARPTPEECQEVHDLLLSTIPPELHHKYFPPDTIPEPSEIVAGCGEVPSILDALIRTLLSANTSGRNSSTAFQGLVARFGLQESGTGKGSVDWNAVRLAPLQDVYDAILHGGMAPKKSVYIKEILDMVYAENQERRNAHIKAKNTNNEGVAPKGAEYETVVQKDAEIDLADEDVLTLDYLHALPLHDALDTFQKYPGVGVKTAACVSLFCMQRPCFAVDTHVFRLSQLLEWVPPKHTRGPRQKKADPDTTFSHLEVMVPDHLKYGLHQLFLEHGKHCARCDDRTGSKSKVWADADCVIDHLVTRMEKKHEAKGRKKMEGHEGDHENEMIGDVEDDEAYTPMKATRGAKAKKSQASKVRKSDTVKPVGRASASVANGNITKDGKEKTTRAGQAKASKGRKKANKIDESDEDDVEDKMPKDEMESDVKGEDEDEN
ncbi:hypothetical protein MMC28_011327 [Mycoblastus sanguinarius]|nr:hypothetical protein [Mycoblastus sanguinarius]